VFAGYGFSETGGGAIRFLPLERMNSILVITGNPAIFDEVQRWIDRLDQPLPNAGIRNYVYKMKNTKAVTIQTVLTNLYGLPALRNQANANVPAVPGGLAPVGGNTLAPPATGAAPGGTPFTAVPAAAAGLPNEVPSGVRIIADEVSNTLIVQTTP